MTTSNTAGTPGIISCLRQRDETFNQTIPPAVHESAWSRGALCEICGMYFSLVRRRHHCRRCGMSVCGSCSNSKLRVRIGLDAHVQAQRACATCVTAAVGAVTGADAGRLALSQPPPLQEAHDTAAADTEKDTAQTQAEGSLGPSYPLSSGATAVLEVEGESTGAWAIPEAAVAPAAVAPTALCWRSCLVPASVLILYYLAGCLFYGLHSGLTVSDSVYFITVSVTTVGYGDHYPQDQTAMVFSIFYFAAGLLLVGALIAQVGAALMVKAEDILMKKLDDNPDDDEEPADWWQIIIALGALLLTLLLGVVFFAFAEGAGLPGGWCESASASNEMGGHGCWEEPWLRALYFCVVTMTMVGYGDLSLQHTHSRWCCVLFIVLSTVMFANTLDQIAQVRATRRAEEKKAAFLALDLDIGQILAMDESGEGKVDKGEFLVFGLQVMGAIEKGDADVRRIVEAFDR